MPPHLTRSGSPSAQQPRPYVYRTGDAQIVIVRGKRWGHAGLLVESRRGSGDWGEIGILGRRSLRDTRPLAVRGQPEVREYRARFFDGTTEISGDGRWWRG